MEEDFINTVEKMAVTAEKIADAINKVRCVDYSALYHDAVSYTHLECSRFCSTFDV